jgi:hypothetical protein
MNRRIFHRRALAGRATRVLAGDLAGQAKGIREFHKVPSPFYPLPVRRGEGDTAMVNRIPAPAGSLRTPVGRWFIGVKSQEGPSRSGHQTPVISSHLQPIGGRSFFSANDTNWTGSVPHNPYCVLLAINKCAKWDPLICRRARPTRNLTSNCNITGRLPSCHSQAGEIAFAA